MGGIGTPEWVADRCNPPLVDFTVSSLPPNPSSFPSSFSVSSWVGEGEGEEAGHIGSSIPASLYRDRGEGGREGGREAVMVIMRKYSFGILVPCRSHNTSYHMSVTFTECIRVSVAPGVTH